jgi:GrpB-like predicted nucleotidyltransferase (UPF0157 family)
VRPPPHHLSGGRYRDGICTDQPTVLLSPYDTTWPLEFAAEADRIARACDGLPIRLEHIGSTAIPGLSAKPVIDILAGRPGNMPGESYVSAFKQLGYEHKGAYGVPGRNYFRRGTPRSHHVHLVSWSSNVWHDHLLFRDYLRAHAETAREYETLKRELAALYAQDKERYTDAKGPFIRSIIRRAKAERSPEE